MKMFEWSGISFGDRENFRIYKAMKRLAMSSGATSLRFWGKFLGRQCDYFVLEGQLSHSEEAKAAAHAEERGKGINAHVYWVTDNLLSDWIQLPDSEPKYINASREVKYIVTGNLNAEINTNPKFPGKERHFLRAQIARIAHATTIIPKDFMSPHEENEKDLQYNEEFNAPSVNDLNSMENWSYHYQNILLTGRAEHETPDVGEDEMDEAVAALEEKDPFVERLKPISDVEGAWSSKLVGNPQQYAGGDEGTVSYNCVEVKSLKWKGAITVSQNGSWANLYIGYGIKTGDVCFNPTTPLKIQEDPDEVTEMPEPTPLEAPAQPEPVAEQEGEGGEPAEEDNDAE